MRAERIRQTLPNMHAHNGKHNDNELPRYLKEKSGNPKLFRKYLCTSRVWCQCARLPLDHITSPARIFVVAQAWMCNHGGYRSSMGFIVERCIEQKPKPKRFSLLGDSVQGLSSASEPQQNGLREALALQEARQRTNGPARRATSVKPLFSDQVGLRPVGFVKRWFESILSCSVGLCLVTACQGST